MGIIIVNGASKTVSANPGEIYYEGSTAYIVMPDNNAGFASSAIMQPTAPAPMPTITANVVSNSAPGFDPDFYKAQNPDVAAAGVDPLNHFRTVGWKEGRDPNPYFDIKGYLATYGDIKAAGVNPLDHYNNNGWKEGRDPSAWFDTSSYLDANPDVKAAGVNPLQHFLANGQFEGRQAIPQVVADTNGAPNAVPVGATNGTPVGVTVSWGGWQTTTYAIANDPSGGGFGINPTTGVVFVADASKLTPGASYSVTVNSFDDGHSIATIFDLAVAGSPVLPPVITSDGGGATASKSVAENTTAVTTVTSTDPDGPTPSYSIVGGADQSKFAINASTGQLSFLTAPNFEAPTDSDTNNTYIVTVRASDGTSNDDQTITVTVTDVNAAPVITSGTTGTIAEGSSAATVVYDANATDDGENSNTLTFSFGGGADDGMFSINSATGEVRFLASPNFEAPADAGDNNVYNIIVRASDGTATADRAVAITVTNVNETPVASDASFSGSEDIAYNGAVPAATDGDGNALTYAVVGGSAVGGSVVVNTNGTFTFTPTANFNGNATFQYVANDGTVNSAPKTVTINFAAVNDAPIADADGPYAIGEDGGTLTVNAAGGVLAGDVDVDTVGLTATLLSGPAHATSFSLNTDGSFNYTPLANFSGMDSFVYRAFDGAAFSDPIVVTINVTAANDAPVATSASFSGSEDIAYNGAVPAATDAEGSTLTYALVPSSAIGGSVVVNTNGTFTFTPTANFNGNASFQYIANDGLLNSAAQTITINFGAVNDAPVALDGILAASEDGGPVMIDVASLISDVETADAGLTVTASVSPSEGTVSVLGTQITFTPAANFNGAASISYTVSDGTLSDTGTVAVTVAAANDAPVAVPSTLSASEDAASVQITLSASDIDAGDAVTSFTLGTLPTSGTFYSDAALLVPVGTGSVVTATGGSATIYFKPNANFNGPVTFNYTASDGDNSSAAAAVTINVASINDAPVALDGILAASEDGGPVMIDVASLISDVETADAGLTVTASVSPSEGTVSVLGTQITFTPAANFNGAASISYTVSDGTLSDTGTVAVTVAAANDAPVAVPSTLSASEDAASVQITLSASDIDAGDAVTSFTLGTLPTSGTFYSDAALLVPVGTGSVVTATGGSATIYFKPNANFNGPVTFNYTASDGDNSSAAATVTINVASINDAPVALDGILAASEDGGPVMIDVASLISDVETLDTSLTVTASVPASQGTVSVLGTQITFTPATNFNGAASISYTVSDGTLSDTATIAVTVTADDDAPVAVTQTVTGIEDQRLEGRVTATDIDGGTATFSGSGTTANGGSYTVNADGSYTYTPALNFNGTDSFTFQVSNGSDPATIGTVNITIGALNDAPVGVADSFTIDEDATPTPIFNVLANDTDVEDPGNIPVAVSRINGTAILVGGTIGVIGGAVTLNADQTLSFTPTADFAGDTSFTYTAKDGSGAESGPTLVSVHVNQVNDAPIAAPNGPLAILEDTPFTVNLLANDSDLESGKPNIVATIDGQAIAVGGNVAVASGTVHLNADQTITFTPTAGASGSGFFFTYQARDVIGGLLSNTVNVTYNIAAVNDAPVANADIGTAPTSLPGFSTNEDTPVILNVLANDTDIESGTPSMIGQINGTPVSVGSVVSVTGGSVTVNTDWTLTFTPDLNSTQDGSFTYTAKDSSGAESAQATVVVDVIAVNDPPVVDLNGVTAGVDRAGLPTYTSGAAAINVATAIAAVTDTENAVSKITLTLTADVGTPDGSPAEGLTLPAGVATALGFIGFTVNGEGTNSIEIISNTAGGISPAVFENILKTVLYHDNDQTFGFNAQDRTITVTATDGSGLASAPALVHIDMAANVTDVNGVSAVNNFLGANLADTIRGNDGNDTMEGAGGDDQIYGGTEIADSGLDTAKFTGDRADYTVTRTGPGVYTVADSVPDRDGTDTVHDVETAHFNGDNFDLQLDAPIQVFDSTGNVLLASFQANQLSQAVNFANGHAGADIIELRSSASPFTSGAWPATVTEAVTIKAVGGTATINAGANSGIAIAESAVLGGTDTVKLEGLNITGSGTTDTVGVVFSGVYEGLTDGVIEILNTSVSGFGQNGVAIIGGGPGLSVTIDGDNAALLGTQTSLITGSGGSTTSGGSGDILFFAFTGAAALKNIVVTGSTGVLPGSADNGIQFAGFDGGDHSVDHAIGAVTFLNVSVNGTYEKNLVYIQGYDNFSALGFSGGLNLGGAGSAATWTALFIDGGPQGIDYNPSGAVGGPIDSTLNLTGVTVAGGTYGTSPGFAVLGSKQIVVNGTLTDDLITGTLANEAFVGLAGDDTINAGDGNDLILHNVGDGHDTVDGQGNTDTLGLINFTGTLPSITPASFAISESGSHLIVQTDGTGAAEVDAAGMESVQATLGNGGDTVTLTGNIAGAGIAAGPGGIIVTGGTSGDTLDASGLGSASAITFSNLGGGNDTFKAANVMANDVVDGAGGIGDSLDYSVASAAVTIDLQANTASGTSVGTDSVSNFENATGGVGGDSISGTAGINTLSGGAGDDTLTGRGDDDILTGGETGETHGDTAAYTGTITAGMIAGNGSGGWTVTSGVTEGTDTLSEIEVVHGANPPGLPTGKFLLVGNGGYATIAAAYAEAVDGDTIVLAAGTYTGDFSIGKAISVVGANYSVNGAGSRGMESILTGHWTVNAASGPVTIDGVEFLNNTPWVSGTNDTRLVLATEATVAHSLFYNTRPGGNKPISDTAIDVTAASGTVSIFDNMFSGDHHGKYFAPLNGSAAHADSASWGGGTTVGGNAGAIVWNGGATLDIDGNTIKYARTALNLTGDDAKLTINDNDFFTSGTAVTATGWSGPVGNVTINTFTDVDNEFNLRSNVTGVDIDFAGNSSDNWFSVLGTTGADIINGTSGKDAVLAEEGDDTVHTAAGNDAIYFNSGATAGNDKADGGSETGKDTLVVSNTSSVNTTLDPGDAGDPVTTVVGSPGGTKTTYNMTVTGDVVTATNGTNSLSDISIVAQTTLGATPLGSVMADEIEDVQFNLGTNGDTVNITGDFSTTSLSASTITINGGIGADTVDARTLSSAHKIVFNGGDGDDTFKASNTTANDIISAGNNGANGDTVDYSAATSSVTINLVDGTASGTSIGSDTVTNFENATGGSANDTIIGTGGNNALSGGGGIDTVTTTSPGGYGAGYQLAIQGGHWVVTNGTNTDTLTGVERVIVNGTTYLLVDQLGTSGGFHQVQDAVNFASGGETILIAPGTYTETGNPTSQPGNLGGLYINTANLTLQGVHADGSPITTAADAKLLGATIVAGEQTDFGANHWVDVGGDNTVFKGVHLQAGTETNNKLLEIWAENVTVQNSFVDVYEGGTNYTFALAIYINDNGSAATDEITKYTIDNNILNEGVLVANGVGDPTAGIGALQKITNNAFEGVFNYITGEGRYDTVVLNGKVAGIAWLLESTQIPTITGNSFAGNETPFLLRGGDDNPANLPTVAQIEAFLAANGNANLTYAYVTNGGALRTDDPDFGSGTTHRFAVTNRIDTLNLALDTETYNSPATHDQVFPDQRIYMQSGDTVHVQSAGATVNSQIMVDNLTVQATQNSTDLNLTLATNFADTTAIPGPGVQTITLADYALDAGANVDVTGNALANTITGNSGANTLDGAGGNDTLHGGGGSDALIGGANTDTATYDDARGNYAVTMHDDNLDGFFDRFSAVSETTVNGTNEGADTLNGVERLVFQSGTPGVPGDDTVYDLTQPIQLIRGGNLVATFSSIQSAVNAADAGDTVLVNGAIQSAFNENVTLSEGITLKGLGTVTINGSVLVDGGGAAQNLTIDNIDLNGTGNYAIQVAETSTYTTLTFKNGNVTGGAFGGLLLGDGNETGGPTGVGTLVIESANFSNNVTAGSGGGGDGAILIYRYNGNVTLKNVDVLGSGTFIENGIQIRGAATLAASGTLSFENVDVHGTFARTGVAIRDYLSATLTFNGSVGNSALDVNVGSGLAYTALHIDNVGGTVDLSGPNAVNAVHYLAPNRGAITMTGLNTAGETFTADDSNDVLVGLGGNDTLNGGAGFDFIDGGAGTDTIDAGAGTDLIVQTAGQGGGTIQGGTEADTVLLRGTSGSDSVTVLYNGSAITSAGGTTLSGVEVVNGTFDATALGGVLPDVSGGSDTLDYTGSSAGVTVNLGGGTASGFAANPAFGLTSAISGFENVTGTALVDSLTGDGGANTLIGAGSNDTFTGGGGSDTLYGGTAAGDSGAADAANFSGALSTYQVSFDPFAAAGVAGIDATVSGGTDGNDTLHGVELLQFTGATLDLTAKVFLFDSANHLVGTFNTIQGAVDAVGASNMTIKIRDGEYAEQIEVEGKTGLTILGQSASVIIKSPAGPLAVTGVSGHWGDDVRANISVENSTNIIIKTLTVDGDYAGDALGSIPDEITGISYLHSSGTIDGVHVEHTSNSIGGGFFGLQHGSGIFVDNGDVPADQLAITIKNSTIDTFQKTGILIWNANVTVTNNDVTGVGATDLIAQNAMQIGGSAGTIGGATAAAGNTFSDVGYNGTPAESSTNLIVYEPSAALTISNNTFEGTGVVGALSVGIDLTDVAAGIIVTVTNNAFGTTGRGLLDGIDAYTFDGALGLNTDPVMSGNTFTEIEANGIFLDPEFVADGPAFTTATAFTETGSQFSDVLHGSLGADTFFGGDGDDDLMGRGGADTLKGEAGNDTIAWTAGDGNDTLIDGGAHTTGDTLQVLDTAGADTIQVVTSGSTLVGIGGGTANVQDIESVTLDATAGGTDTLDYTGTTTVVSANLATNVLTGFNSVVALSTIENVTGGSAGDTLIGSSGANVINGAAGNDQITGAGGDDTLSGGADSDTFNYTVGDGQDTVDGGSTGSDVDTLNIAGTALTETYNINPITGYLGINIESGIADVDATDGNYEIRTVEVEEIVITTNGGGDSVILAGDLAGTGVASSTVRVTGDGGSNTFDASGIIGDPVRVVFDGAGGTDTLTGGNGDDILIGGDGNDTLKGGAGNDTIYGGTDLNASDTGTSDTVVYDHTPGGYSVTFNPGGTVTITDTNLGDGDEGTDTLAGVESINLGGTLVDFGANVLVYRGNYSGSGAGVLVGSYATIGAALAAGGTLDGDTMVVRAGDYAENLSIGKGVKILGAQHGVDGTGHTGIASGTGETNIKGLWTIATANSVVIDGVRFFNTSPEGSGSDASLAITSAAAATVHQVLNSVFYSNVDGGDRTASEPVSPDPIRDDRAIYIGLGASAGSIVIDDNYVTGSMTGKYGTASWGRGIWGDLNGASVTVSGNTFEYVRTGINFDRYAGSVPTVSDNTFKDAGTAIALGVNWSTISGITGSVMNNVDLEFNFQNLSGPITFDVGAAVATFIDASPEPNPIEDYIHVTGSNGVDTITGSTFADAVEGRGGNDSITTGGGNDYLDGGTGTDTLTGGDGDDTYVANNLDTLVEGSGVNSGTDTVFSNTSYVLGANVENLTLLEGATRLEDFENFTPGAITDGENGWKHAGAHDQSVVAVGLGSGNAFRMSSDPSNADFGGPYTPGLADTAGEPSTTADFDGQFVRFQFKPVNSTPDESRLEVDIGTAAGDDRNNFMLIESSALTNGIRIAVASPANGTGDFGPAGTFPNDRTTLATGIDPTVVHEIALQVVYKDGANNDVIRVYLDGKFIGETTTFENYRDFSPETAPHAAHSVSAEANQTNRLFFRAGNNGQPEDGPNNQNAGFLFDNIAYGVGAADGTGNLGNNVITGNSGNNTLTGMGGDDTLIGGGGHDTFVYALGDGQDIVHGDAGTDLLHVTNGGGQASILLLGAGPNVLVDTDLSATPAEIVADGIENVEITLGGSGDTVAVVGSFSSSLLSSSTITVGGGAGGDTVDASALTSTHRIVFTGGGGDDMFVSSNAGGNDTFDGGANGTNGDEVSYLGVSNPAGVNVNLATGIATGAGTDTLIGVENVVGTNQADTLIGNGSANFLEGEGGDDTLTGDAGNDTLDGCNGTGDTVNYAAETGLGAVTVDFATGSATDTFGNTDTLIDIENVKAGSGTADTVILSGLATDWTVSFASGKWTATNGVASHELVGVERLQFTASLGTYHLLDNDGTGGSDYGSLQSVINAASSGDTLLLSSGTFAGAVDIGGGAATGGVKDLTILGANHGTDASLWTLGSETIIDRIGANGGDLTLDGVKVVGTIMGAGFVSGFQREAIGFIGDANDDLTVRHSVVTINGSHYGDINGDVPFGEPGVGIEDYGFGFNIGYNTGNITLDDVHVTAFSGLVPVGVGDFTVGIGMWINGSSTRSIAITDSSFDTDQQRSQSIVFDSQPGGAQINISGNTFGEVGSQGRGAIRLEDFANALSGPLDYSGIDNNIFLDAPNASTFGAEEYGLVRNGTGEIVTVGTSTYAGPVAYDQVISAFSTSAGQTLNGGATADIIVGSNASASGDTITGGGGNDHIEALAGDDTITGAAGADVINGGAGSDKAIYGGNADDYSLVISGTSLIVTDTRGGSPDGADTLSGVEQVKFADDTILYVDGASGTGHYGAAFTTIGAALAAANAIVGHVTIMVAAGNYSENLTISRNDLVIVGAGDSTVILGTFKTDNGIAPGTAVSDFLEGSVATPSSASGTALTIGSDNVTIKTLKIDSFATGINIGNGVDGLTLVGVTIEDTVNGIRKGTGAAVTNLEIHGGAIRDGGIGMYIAKETADGLDLDGLLIDGTMFQNLSYKGIYAETMSDALITNITMSDVGQFGQWDVGLKGRFGNGIDLNLKWDHEATNDTATDDDAPYSDITIDTFTFTNVGLSSGAGTPHLGGAAIAVKARNLGSYASPETASFLDAVIIRHGTITGTSTGIRAGEPGQSVTDPDVTITDVKITGEVQSATHGDVDNVTQSPMTVNMIDGGDSLIASPTTTGVLIVNGGTGADTITTRGGADTISAGGGIDTVNAGDGDDTVIGTATDATTDTYNGGNGTDTINYSALIAGEDISINLGSGGASGAAIGGDSLTSFENATAGGGDDSVFGSLGNNVLHGGGGTDNIVGDGGSDQLFGDVGTDTLNGGANDFVVTPGSANDVLWGGTGDDTFRFEGRFGADAIGAVGLGNADWTDEEDMVFVGYAAFAPIIVDVTDGVLITVNDGTVSSSVFVAGATAGLMQTQISGLDLIIH